MAGFSFERVAQSDLEWIFSKLDSGFQSSVGFRIPCAGFRIPDSGFQSPGFRIPQAKNSWISESGFPYMGRDVVYSLARKHKQKHKHKSNKHTHKSNSKMFLEAKRKRATFFYVFCGT